ncbi:hypothetical protein N665_0717s0012 [Sinapis alba]|nr:hypothetical protein N665_0717s0012 [Sinapis alba]
MDISHKQTLCKFTFLDSDILFFCLRLLITKSKDKQSQRNARIAYFSLISFPVCRKIKTKLLASLQPLIMLIKYIDRLQMSYEGNYK